MHPYKKRAGHNGAGAAELAAARLHVLLAAHPALRTHTGELGPPAVARAEEVAVAAALRHAFGQVDEATLAVARRDGVRDGATALVVLRLGRVLYAAHAGDSRAVLVRDRCVFRSSSASHRALCVVGFWGDCRGVTISARVLLPLITNTF